MSRRPVESFLVALLSTAALAAVACGFAGASSLEAMLAGGLAPSAAPQLLGPITESGRTGWACKPERAAAARTAQDAELPAASDTDQSSH